MRAFLTVLCACRRGARRRRARRGARAVDARWRTSRWPIGRLLAGTCCRCALQQIPLTKYGALNLLAMPAVAGALIVGAPASALALWRRRRSLADALLLRKGAQIAWINAGREVVALIAAYGIFAWASVSIGARAHAAERRDAAGAGAAACFAYFLIEPAAAVLHAAAARQALDEEKSLILRYEVIAFGAGSDRRRDHARSRSATSSRWAGCSSGVVLGGAGLLVKRILEESIAAEELNKILAMEQVVSSDVDIGDAFRRIEALAHRLVDWQEFRIARLENGALVHVFRGDSRAISTTPREPDAQPRRTPRRRALRTGDVITRRATCCATSACCRGARAARSVVVLPLRFGDRVVGMLELEHHKPDAYRDEGGRARCGASRSSWRPRCTSMTFAARCSRR